ncbi:hypothetical protein [Dyadobacter sp. CY312]|uniref:hypothetical protein n=1 Tax=Dyadobacter sp. CY312 TaxID=2907303 RepID=UPI001F3828A2|nr:hypothetical protein [Dyadobacter sp. CY312]MCE7042045.1 hypothetical protein [Dyadobacter sp. CY312]
MTKSATLLAVEKAEKSGLIVNMYLSVSQLKALSQFQDTFPAQNPPDGLFFLAIGDVTTISDSENQDQKISIANSNIVIVPYSNDAASPNGVKYHEYQLPTLPDGSTPPPITGFLNIDVGPPGIPGMGPLIFDTTGDNGGPFPSANVTTGQVKGNGG